MTAEAPDDDRSGHVGTPGLTTRLQQLADRGIIWPCAGRSEWLANDPDVRRSAAPLCLACPALVACRLSADAHNERFGVWAGVDRTPPSH